MTTSRPFFSIIMPVYNHAGLVGRAIRSCLDQSFGDFEIVAVDDASTDGSAAAIAAIADPRLHLFHHQVNRGVCPTRNTAMAHARGEWFVYLDSDDELLPGALEVIYRRAVAAGPDIGGMRYMAVDEQGLTPDPGHDDKVWVYDDYLRWFDRAIRRRHEALPCMRASFYPEVQFPDDRSSEMLYHLELFRRTKVWACRDIVRRYHHHFGERITAPRLSRSIGVARDVAANAEIVFERHGADMRRIAPRLYFRFLAGAATASLLAGRRRAGLRFGLLALRVHPLSLPTWLILAIGFANRWPLAVLQWMNREIRRRLRMSADGVVPV
jgi:glycosyltransferase involved in cell wall biosynthesis